MSSNVAPQAVFSTEWDQANLELKKEFNFFTIKEKHNFLSDKKLWFIFSHTGYKKDFPLIQDGPKKSGDSAAISDANLNKKTIKIRYETVAKNLSSYQDIDWETLNTVKYTN